MSLIGEFMAASPFTTAFLRGDDLPNAWGVDGSVAYTDAESALSATAVYQCIRVLSEDVSALPMHVYRRLPDGGKEIATDHYLYRLLNRQPDGPRSLSPTAGELTNVNFYSAMMGHTELRGNHFSQIIHDRGGRPAQLKILRPDRMSIGRSADDGRLLYSYRLQTGRTRTFERDEILHVRNLSPDGLVGYSSIALFQQAIGLAISTERYGMQLFTKGARPDGIVTVKGRLTPDQRESFKSQFNEMHQNKRGIAVFEDGTSWQAVGMPPEESQFLATRRFQKEDIAGIFRMPAHKIGVLERATFANVEAMATDYVVGLLPRLVNIEAEIQRQLFPEDDDVYFAQFNLDSLLRGTPLVRHQMYAIGKQWGLYSTNDIHRFENMNPIEDPSGDAYWMPANMIEMGKPRPQGVSTQPPSDGGMGGMPGTGAYDGGRMDRVEAVVSMLMDRLDGAAPPVTRNGRH